MALPHTEVSPPRLIETLESYLSNILLPDRHTLAQALKSPTLSTRDVEMLTLEVERLDGLIAAYRKVLQNERYLYLQGCFAEPAALKVKIQGRPPLPLYEDMLPF